MVVSSFERQLAHGIQSTADPALQDTLHHESGHGLPDIDKSHYRAADSHRRVVRIHAVSRPS